MKTSTPLTFSLAGPLPDFVRREVVHIKLTGYQDKIPRVTGVNGRPPGGPPGGGGGGGGGGGSDLGAITFNAPLITTLVPVTATGGSGFTFGRNSTAYVADWENLLKFVKNAECRFIGARRVYNLLAVSEALDNAAWLKSVATIGTGVSDPLGGTTAFTMTATGASAQLYQSFNTTPVPVTMVASVWLKRRTGTGNIKLYAGSAAGGTGVVLTLTGSWQRFSVSEAGAATRYFFLEIATSGDAIDVWHPQYEDVSGQSNQNPSEYVSTGVLADPWHGANTDGVKYFATKNGNTVASNVVTEATGVAINTANGASSVTCDASGPLGLLIEESRSNLRASSEAFGSWNLTRTTVTSNTQIAPDGYSTADVLNEDATTNSHFCFLSTAKAASAITYTHSVFVKKSGRDWVLVETSDGAAAYVDVYFNVNTGTIGTASSSGFTYHSSSITPYKNGWYRCSVVVTSNTGGFITSTICTADGDGDVTTVGLNGAALYLWGDQVEQRSFMTSYMPSGIAPPYEGFTYNSFAGNASATQGTIYVETKTDWSTAGDVYPLVSFGIATLYPLYSNSEASTIIRMNDGTNNVARTGINNMQTAVVKVACSWTGTTLRINGSGASAVSGTFDGNMGSTAIGIGNPTTGTGVVWNGTIRNLTIYSGAANNGQLNSMT